MAKIGLPKGSGKWLKVREKSVKSQGILKWILSGNPVDYIICCFNYFLQTHMLSIIAQRNTFKEHCDECFYVDVHRNKKL